MNWLINVILTILIDPIYNGIRRVLKGRVIIGILWLITGGVFGIGWIIDIITVIFKGDITVLA